MISKQDLRIFEDNFYLYEMLIKHSFVRNYTKETYSDLIRLYTIYVSDKHNFSHWCSSCRAELVNHLFQWYINNKPSNEVVINKQEAEAVITPTINTDEEIIEQQIQVYKKKKKK